MLVELVSNRHLNAQYVTKNSAPRNVYFAELRKDDFKLNYVKNLFKGSGSYYDVRRDTFDCHIVDESHRLNAKSGLFSNKGENQIKEIINAACVSVFFIDEDQCVTAKDIGFVQEIKNRAREIGIIVYSGDELRLTSQFRCNGSDGYIAFLDDLLDIRNTANAGGFDMEYDLQVYDDPCAMHEDLRVKNLLNNKSRMLAGYCYEWVTKKSNDLEVYDIDLPNGFKARWNFSNTDTWAINLDSFDQVGCIHTSQGLEFDYIGVIIGKDLVYRDGKVQTDKKVRANTDASLNGLKRGQDNVKVDRIIRNTYKALLTSGQKGCYIYCEDEALQEYIKQRIEAMSAQEATSEKMLTYDYSLTEQPLMAAEKTEEYGN